MTGIEIAAARSRSATASIALAISAALFGAAEAFGSSAQPPPGVAGAEVAMPGAPVPSGTAPGVFKILIEWDGVYRIT
ncbi:MAG: hypothetical protein MI919_09585, partial [Holophagales bacterium]|nr:hypothetical protein [Holophagales bacterium]